MAVDFKGRRRHGPAGVWRVCVAAAKSATLGGLPLMDWVRTTDDQERLEGGAGLADDGDSDDGRPSERPRRVYIDRRARLERQRAAPSRSATEASAATALSTADMHG